MSTPMLSSAIVFDELSIRIPLSEKSVMERPSTELPSEPGPRVSPLPPEPAPSIWIASRTLTRMPGWVFPSMTTGLLIVGRPFGSEIVHAAAPGILNAIVSGLPLLSDVSPLTWPMAQLRVPIEPLSVDWVTVKVVESST